MNGMLCSLQSEHLLGRPTPSSTETCWWHNPPLSTQSLCGTLSQHELHLTFSRIYKYLFAVFRQVCLVHLLQSSLAVVHLALDIGVLHCAIKGANVFCCNFVKSQLILMQFSLLNSEMTGTCYCMKF